MLLFSSSSVPRFSPLPHDGAGPGTRPEPRGDASYQSLHQNYLMDLAAWAETARAVGQYRNALDAAIEVMTELSFGSRDSVLRASPQEVVQRVPEPLRPCAAQALSVLGREAWSRTKRDGVSEADAIIAQQEAYEFHLIACAFDPLNIEYQRTLQNIAAESRKAASSYRGNLLKPSATLTPVTKQTAGGRPVDLLTQGAFESLERFLEARFKMNPLTLELGSAQRTAHEGEILQWALEQATSILLSRAGAMGSRGDRTGASELYKRAVAYGLACFRAMELPTDSQRIKALRPSAWSNQGVSEGSIKRVMRVARMICSGYEALAERALCYQFEQLAKDAGAAADRAPRVARPALIQPVLGARPSKPPMPQAAAAQERPPSSQQPVRAVGFEALAIPDAPAARTAGAQQLPKKSRGLLEVTQSEWLDLVERVNATDPLTVPTLVLNDCTSQLFSTSGGRVTPTLRNQTVFPPDRCRSAIIEFAKDVDLLHRGGAAAAHLFLEHHRILFDEMKTDVLALVRLQVTCSFLKVQGQVADNDHDALRELAKRCNITLQGMQLRQDHATAQKIFQPVVEAAIRQRLR